MPQGQPRSYDFAVLSDAAEAVRTFIHSSGTDASVSGWVLGEDFQLLVQNVLSSECEEVCRAHFAVARCVFPYSEVDAYHLPLVSTV